MPHDSHALLQNLAFRSQKKANDLIAVPFDKGVGICLMKVTDYRHKMDSLINLPQFIKFEQKRKNARHPVFKEEERVETVLKGLKDNGKISEDLYQNLKPCGSQPPRLYGLAKVHKKDTPMRPVLSMPGSAYYKVGQQVAIWLSHVPECKINTSTKVICDSLNGINLSRDEELVSFDVTSLYTNVPVKESILCCANLLLDGKSKLDFIN